MIISHEQIANNCKARKIPMSQVSYLQELSFESPIIYRNFAILKAVSNYARYFSNSMEALQFQIFQV